MKFSYVIIGAGITGITMAERLASSSENKVLIIEKRSQIGGNLYDYFNNDGILVHKYGPHIVHTNNKKVWNYLSDFTEWNYYQHKVKAYVDGNLVSIPINLKTINEIYNLNLTSYQMEDFLNSVKVKDKEILNAEDIVLSQIGKDLYEKIYKNYTFKQWDIETKDLDSSILKRLPIRLNSDERYFSDQYQGVPKCGYSKMFDKMLKNKNIKILLNTDYKEVIDDIEYEHLIYTGAIDHFFNYKHGKLKYRGLKFQYETFDYETYQEVGTVNYPNDYDFTRITEYKHLTNQVNSKTTIVREYPCWNGEEYYPVDTKEMQSLYKLYSNETYEDNILFIGRLAEYKYYNIDQVVERALDVAEQLLLRGV